MTGESTEVITIPIRFVNSFLLRGERSILIDTGMKGSCEIIEKALREHAVDPASISLIIITHCHHDHFGDLARIRELTRAKVAIHRLEAELLAAGKNAEVRGVGFAGKLLALIGPYLSPRQAGGVEPDILIDSELRLDEYGVPGKVIHTPGHTEGSVSIVLPGGDIFVGDLLMGFKEKGAPGLPLFATDPGQVKKSVSRLLEYEPRWFHPAHGGPGSAEHIRRLLGQYDQPR